MSETPAKRGARTVPALVRVLRDRGQGGSRGLLLRGIVPGLRAVVLVLVPLLGGGRHATALAADLGVTRQAVAPVVAALERDGYVRRVSRPRRRPCQARVPHSARASRTAHARQRPRYQRGVAAKAGRGPAASSATALAGVALRRRIEGPASLSHIEGAPGTAVTFPPQGLATGNQAAKWQRGFVPVGGCRLPLMGRVPAGQAVRRR